MKSSLLHPHDLSSPSLPKIKCAFHPEELLTNFCKAKECFLPLCPSCITIHISEHITMKTTPIIENISDSIRTLHQQLESYSEKTNGLYKQFVILNPFRSKGNQKSINSDKKLRERYRTPNTTLFRWFKIIFGESKSSPHRESMTLSMSRPYSSTKIMPKRSFSVSNTPKRTFSQRKTKSCGWWSSFKSTMSRVS